MKDPFYHRNSMTGCVEDSFPRRIVSMIPWIVAGFVTGVILHQFNIIL